MVNKIRLSSILFIIVLSVVMLFALSFTMVNTAHAATITADTTGDWSATGTWAGDVLPGEDDDVVIAENVTVTLDQDATVNSILISDGDSATGLTIEEENSLTVGGNFTFEAPIDIATSTFAIGAGTVDILGDLEIISGGSDTEVSVVSISTGELNVDGSIIFDGTVSAARLISTDESVIRVGGDFEDGGTFTRGLSEVIFNGNGAQNIGVYDYTNIVIDKSDGTATLLGDTWLGGYLTISAGTLDTSTHGFDVTNPTTIADGATLIHGTGHKIQNGNLVIDEGGTWTETGEATVQFLGHVTNNGTFTANTGLHTFGTFPRTINGTLSIPNVTFTGDYINNGTFTVGTSLAGTHTLTNGATGILNIGGAATITGFVASAVGNIVNYTGAEQTIKIPTGGDYHTLTFGGSGTKTIESGIDVAGDLTIEDDVRANVTGASTANKLYLDGELQFVGVWGSNASDAQFKNNNYFSGLGTVTTADGTVFRNRSRSNGSSPGSREQAKRMWDAYHEKETPTIESLMKRVAELQVLLAQLQGQPTSSIDTTPLVCSPLLKQGTRSEEVRKLQQKLNVQPQSGFFGPLTAQAVRAFQTEKGIRVDGIVGPETCAMFN